MPAEHQKPTSVRPGADTSVGMKRPHLEPEQPEQQVGRQERTCAYVLPGGVPRELLFKGMAGK